jgi:hypothetical protein
MTDDTTKRSPRWGLLAVILVMVAGSVGYRLLVANRLGQTSALFIGLPAVLAILIAFTRPASSATGVILKGMTILLLLSGILLGEGFICIVMAAPLFYLVGFIIGLTIDAMRRRRAASIDTRLYGLILLPFVPLSLEGVSPLLSYSRAEKVAVERVIPATPAEVERAMTSTPRFEKTLPLFLRLRFPRPEAAWGDGLEPGAFRAVRFSAPKDAPGILVVRVSDRSPGFVRFIAESDTSMIASWLEWRSVDVHWKSVSRDRTRVRWTVNYVRRLDPAWYFGPWQRYAVRLAARYMIQSAAMPNRAGTP